MQPQVAGTPAWGNEGKTRAVWGPAVLGRWPPRSRQPGSGPVLSVYLSPPNPFQMLEG